MALPNTDARYTIAPEFCGYEKPRFVIRFCGRWVAQYATEEEAKQEAIRHNARRIGIL